MSWFDFFKKKTKQQDFDPTSINIKDLDVGFLLDYNLSHFTVKETLTYDWGDQCFSKEHRIEDEKQTLFLSVSTEDGLELAMWEKISLADLQEDIVSHYQKNKELPSRINYKGETFALKERCPGYMQSKTASKINQNWQEIMSNDYESSSNRLLCIEQWGDLEFEASLGKPIKEFEISNILPSEQP